MSYRNIAERAIKDQPLAKLHDEELSVLLQLQAVAHLMRSPMRDHLEVLVELAGREQAERSFRNAIADHEEAKR